MKKLCVILILCLTMLAAAAMAETQESWNDGSQWRLSGEASVWNLATDAAAGKEAVFTLDKGTWVRVVAQNGEWTVIDYFAGGSVRSGAVKSSLVVRADGVATAAPTVSPTPIPLATAAPSIATPAPTMSPMLSPLTPAGSTEAPAAATAVPGKSFMVTAQRNGETVTGAVITLGSHTTILENFGERFEVSTADITFTDSVPAEQQIAVITAPKGGTATVRKEAKNKSDTVTKLKDGTLVCVLSIGKDFCQIWVNGQTGYVSPVVLDYDVYVAEPVGTATLRGKNGKTTGNGTAAVRVAPKKSAKQADAWAIGTVVTVLKVQDDWYLVEKDGQRGYVNTTFILMNE